MAVDLIGRNHLPWPLASLSEAQRCSVIEESTAYIDMEPSLPHFDRWLLNQRKGSYDIRQVVFLILLEVPSQPLQQKSQVEKPNPVEGRTELDDNRSFCVQINQNC